MCIEMRTMGYGMGRCAMPVNWHRMPLEPKRSHWKRLCVPVGLFSSRTAISIGNVADAR